MNIVGGILVALYSRSRWMDLQKFNVQNTVRDVNIIFKMMYERSKTNQLDYYPELKL